MRGNGGRLLVESVIALGATKAFGVPGESYLAVLDALYDTSGRYVLCRNEGGAAFMAAAWGKLKGKPGICFVTRGPGAALAKAYGFHAERTSTTKEFPAAFERAMSSRSGAVLDLEISSKGLTPRQTLSQMRETALASKRVAQ